MIGLANVEFMNQCRTQWASDGVYDLEKSGI